MKAFPGLLLLLAITIPAFSSVYAQGSVGTATASGIVVHVSENNIKITNPKTTKSLSFLIMPNFDQIFSFDGRATHQIKAIMPGQYVMQAILPGQYVKIYYDQKLLGQRRADLILLFAPRQNR